MLDDLANGIAAKDRAVFDGPLEALLGAVKKAWTPDALAAFATKSPDRCAQALILIAKLSGYSERHEVTAPPAGLLGFIREMQGLPDAELLRRLQELRGAIRQPPPRPDPRPAPPQRLRRSRIPSPRVA
jgi:hypothetical protein